MPPVFLCSCGLQSIDDVLPGDTFGGTVGVGADDDIFEESPETATAEAGATRLTVDAGTGLVGSRPTER